MSSVVEKERGAVKKGEGNGVSSSKKVDESKKRRLILSDSDSDDCLVSFRKVDRRSAQNRDSSSIGEGNGVELERMKEKEKVEVEEKKKVLRSHVQQSEELVVADNTEVVEPELERKRSREPSDAEDPAKKLKMDFSEQGGKIKYVTGGNKSITDSSHRGDDKKETKAHKDAGSKPLVPARRGRDGVMDNTSKTEAEKIKSIESSGNKKLWMKDNSSSFAAEKRADTGILQCKGGVLSVLPSKKKVDGSANYHSKRKDEEKLKALASARVATRDTLKQPPLSPERRVYGKSNSGATLSRNESRKAKIDIPEGSRSSKPKTEPKIVSPKREKKRADKPKSRTGFKIKSSSSSKTAFMAEQKSNKASATRSTEKQKLRDQIKNILLSAGWTIDLRPRKGRNYEDSVYIPPDGQGGYWSITKAYAVYQEQLNRTCNEGGKNSSGRSSRTSSGSDCMIPMESLNILKRIVVNKRRRRKEELEEAKRGKKKKAKKTSDMRHSRDEDTEDKLDEIRGRKKPNYALSSNTKISVGSKHLSKGRNKQRGCALLARGSNQEAEAEDNDYVPYVWKRTVLSWMIDMGVLPINGKVKYMNQRKTKTKLEGWITRDGINCSCCSKTLTVSKFELHAGSKLLQPLQNIFLEDGGVSLLQCQLDAWEKQDESERKGFYNVDVSGDDPNDDTCGICGDGGDLICCDGCPSTFHLSCLGIEKLPPGDWHCTNCCCRYCGGISTDANCQSNGTVSSLLSCHQCEAKYHQDCVPEVESVSASSKSPGISFCAQSCRKVFKRLQKILGTKNDLEAGFSWSVIRRSDEDTFKSPLMSHLMAECNSKTAVALAVMDECFLPIVDQRSGINLIHNVVYNCGSNFHRLNYRGFYSFILERGDEIICVASIRIHGTRLAEMPFIGTRNMYRRQGMCRRLLSGIELALGSLNVEKLVIPAISELKDTWTNVFGFKPLEVSQELEVRSINILVFPGTGLLQKPLLKVYSSEQYTLVDGVGTVEYDIKLLHQMKSTHESSEPSTNEPNLHSSGQAVVHCVTQDAVSSLTSSKVAPDSSDSPRSKCKSPEYKSSEIAGDVYTHKFPEGDLRGSHDEDKPQVYLSTDNKKELTSELTLFGNHERKNLEVDSQECDVVSKHTSPNGFASPFQKSGASSPRMLPTDCNLLQHKYEHYCTSLDLDASTLKARKNVELPICSLESTSTPTLHYESHATTKAHSPNSAEGNGQASPESTRDANHDENSLMDHLYPSIHAVSKEIMHAIHNVKAKDAVFDPKGAGKESGASYSSGAVPDFDKNSRFSIHQSILDGVHITNGTVCESDLSCVVKSCKIPGEIDHSDLACSTTQAADIHDVQPDLTTSNEVATDVLAKSRRICNELANGVSSIKDEVSSLEPLHDCGLCVHDASVDIKNLDIGSKCSQ